MDGERAAMAKDLLLSVTIVVLIISISRYSTLRTSIMTATTHLDSQLHMRAECRDKVSSAKWLYTLR